MKILEYGITYIAEYEMINITGQNVNQKVI